MFKKFIENLKKKILDSKYMNLIFSYISVIFLIRNLFFFKAIPKYYALAIMMLLSILLYTKIITGFFFVYFLISHGFSLYTYEFLGIKLATNFVEHPMENFTLNYNLFLSVKLLSSYNSKYRKSFWTKIKDTSTITEKSGLSLIAREIILLGILASCGMAISELIL